MNESTAADRWSDPRVAERILRSFRVWAVVGCSSDPARPSFGVSRYLLGQGYDIVPINPQESVVHGQQSYPDLRAAAAQDGRGGIEVVDLFRRSDLVRPHIEEAIEIGARAIWMQLGVWDEDSAEIADEAGLLVVMNRCPAIDHPALIGDEAGPERDPRP
jgi:predicted CoA-binding protein